MESLPGHLACLRTQSVSVPVMVSVFGMSETYQRQGAHAIKQKSKE